MAWESHYLSSNLGIDEGITINFRWVTGNTLVEGQPNTLILVDLPMGKTSKISGGVSYPGEWVIKYVWSGGWETSY